MEKGVTRQTGNPARQDPEKAPSDLGPLPWLISFANMRNDGREARGPMEKLLESRFLGLDGHRRGYAG